MTIACLCAAYVAIGHVKVVQSGPGAVHARLARNLLLVDRGGKGLRRPGRGVADIAPFRFHQLAQRLPPRLLVGRVDEYAVDIEDRTLEPGGHSFLCLLYTSPSPRDGLL